jgi:hypothetical protein
MYSRSNYITSRFILELGHEYERFINDILGKDNRQSILKECFQFLILIFPFCWSLMVCMNVQKHYDSFIFIDVFLEEIVD